MNVKLIWQNFLNNIEKDLNPLAFETWFKETELYEYKDGICKIIVPMSIYKKHLTNKYYDLIINNLNMVTNNQVEIEFYTKEEIDELDNNSNNIETIGSNNNPIISDNISYKHCSNLNKNQTFENFIVGNTNKFAQRAALEVSESPGKLYNPLFIYGNSGLGKTHLMHAIGNYIEEHSNLKVLYVTCDEFTSDFIKISRKNGDGTNFDKVDYFKDKYRNLDVLIIDDIQFFETTPKSQDEFFKIFDELHRNNKQIVVSSDRSPDDLKKLEERLRTRFCWGLTADIYPPDTELRIDIIKKKIIGEQVNKNIPDDVIEYIAHNVGNNVRYLEGAVNRLIAESIFEGGAEINLDLAVEALKDDIDISSHILTMDSITDAVCSYYNITKEEIKGGKKSKNIALPRQVAIYLILELLSLPQMTVSDYFGGRDHSTIIYARDKISTSLETDNLLKKQVKDIRNIIQKN